MKFLQLILILILITNCKPIKQLKNHEYCATKNHFGEVDNIISISDLDSIIFSWNLKYLNDYKTHNSIERKAIKLIKDTVKTMGFKTNEFTIRKIDLYNGSYKWILSRGIFNNQDETVGFMLSHIDGFVYSYNLDKLNLEYKKNPDAEGYTKVVIGICGNFSGHDGIYLFTKKSNRIVIYKHQ